MPKPVLVKVPSRKVVCECCKGTGEVIRYKIETRGAWTPAELAEQKAAEEHARAAADKSRAEMEQMWRETDALNPDRCEGEGCPFGSITICTGCGDPQDDCSCGKAPETALEGS